MPPPHPAICKVLTSTAGSPPKENAVGEWIVNWPSAAAMSSRGSAPASCAASDTEQLPHRAPRILEDVQAHLQQRRGGRIELRDVEALLDRRPDEAGGTE